MGTKKKNYFFERVFVETSVDTDNDGKLDLIAVYIKRPVSTKTGHKVPAVLVANPYLMTCNEDWYVPYNVDVEVKAYPEQNISEPEIRYDHSIDRTAKNATGRTPEGEVKYNEIPENIEFECISEIYDHLVDRDYAAVYCGGLGTRGSDGLTLTGSREEVLAFKAVIDWLNGRVRAFTDKENNIEIKAWWCTGKVAMNAKSYLGTMCIGVASTGVEGLETIIPEAGISNWYNYYRSNGLNVPAMGWQGDDIDILAKYCSSRAKDPDDFLTINDKFDKAQAFLEAGADRVSGNYNRFWDERNYLNWIDDFKASVFIIHGINDWNVKTNQCLPLFEMLQEKGIERKMHLHQGEHVYIYKLKDSNTITILDRWLDHYLKGIDNGIEKEPKVMVQSNLDQSKWMPSDVWPPEDSQIIFIPEVEGEAVIVDDLSKTEYRREDDNLQDWLNQLVLSKDPNYYNKLEYVFEPKVLKNGNVRFAGTAIIEFDAAIDRPTGILSAMIVDLGEDCRITAEEIKVGDEYRFGVEETPSLYKVITRNSMNAQNRSCIWSKEEIKGGKFYHYALEMVPTDYTIRKGHKIGVIIYGIDAEQTQRPDTVTVIKIRQESVKISCPLIEC